MEFVQFLQGLPVWAVLLLVPSIVIMYSARLWVSSASARVQSSDTLTALAATQTERSNKLSDALVEREQKIGGLSVQIADLGRRLSTVEHDLSVQKTLASQYKIEVDKLRGEVIKLTDDLVAERRRSDAYSVENAQLKRKITELETQVSKLENKLREMRESQKRETQRMIHLVDESESETK